MSNQHSKCDDCYKTHLPEVHDRTILPSEAFSEGYVPEFNQASEDELLKKIDSIMPQCGEIDCDTCTKRHKRVLDLIRTEKLKLLAEVRERAQSIPVHGGTDSYYASKRIQAVPIDVLTKLEAEL